MVQCVMQVMMLTDDEDDGQVFEDSTQGQHVSRETLEVTYV